MRKVLKIIFVVFGIYSLAWVLGYVVMGDLTDKYRWDLLFMFWGGILYMALSTNKESK